MLPVASAWRGRPMLVLSFPAPPGEALASSRSHCFRIGPDGALRGGDNAIAARHERDGWRFGHRLLRDIECAGPVIVRARRTQGAAASSRGPYGSLRIVAGVLFADDVCLQIVLPTWGPNAADCWYELTLLPAQAAD